MPSPPAWNLIRALAAGIAVLFALAIWSGEAHAGCGDHVVILSKKTSDGVNADELPTAPLPCSGPHCSLKQAPSAPLPPAPVHAKLLPLDALLTADAASDHDVSRHHFTDLISLPVHQATEVFRPPRYG